MKTQHKKQSKTKQEDITIVGCCPCNSHKNKRGINKYFYCMNIKIKNKKMAIIFGNIIQTLLYILYVNCVPSRPIVVKKEMWTMAGQHKQKMVTKRHYVP